MRLYGGFTGDDGFGRGDDEFLQRIMRVIERSVSVLFPQRWPEQEREVVDSLKGRAGIIVGRLGLKFWVTAKPCR